MTEITVLGKKIKFVNRKQEINTLEKLAEKGSTTVEYIYGPEGCGKTTLLKHFIATHEKYTGIYINALELKDINQAIYTKTTPQILEIASEILKNTAEPIGPLLAKAISLLVTKLSEKTTLENKHIVIAVDDATKALGTDKIEWYTKYLYETINKLYEKHSPASVLILATTSEGESLNLVWRHTYVSPSIIWNLDKKHYTELALQLNPPSQQKIEETWQLTGGNPRTLIEIALKYNWNTEQWLTKLQQQLTRVIKQIKEENLEKELTETIENPDIFIEKPSKKTHQLEKILTQANLIIYINAPTLTQKPIPQNPELNTGKYYAWQLPAYPKTLKQLIKP